MRVAIKVEMEQSDPCTMVKHTSFQNLGTTNRSKELVATSKVDYINETKATHVVKTKIKAENIDEIEGFYKISTMDASMSPDPRCKLEAEIMKLSQLMRDTPIVSHCGQDEVTTQLSTVPILQNARQFPKKALRFY